METGPLIAYVNELILEKQIPSWESAVGLYAIGDPDEEMNQLEHSIIAENKTDQLRAISIDALLSLAEFLANTK
jgi:hypothetical protein